MRPHPLLIPAAAIWTCTTGMASVIDQSLLSPPHAATLITPLAEGFAYTAQTVTAGITGTLDAVDIQFTRAPVVDTSWEVTIHDVASGQPTGSVLASKSVPAADVPTAGGADPVHVAFDAPPSFSAGRQFAIVLRLEGTSGIPGLGAGSWFGNAADPYPGGRTYISPDGVNFMPSSPAFDLFFQTHVTPEPASLALLAAGLMACAGPRRRSA